MVAAETANPVLHFPRPAASRPAEAILLSPPELTGGEAAAAAASLASGWLAPAGPWPAAFEAAVALATGQPHVLATASGTAALHLGCHVLGVGRGDEVWAPTLTFIASIAPAVQLGATPRFLDVAPGSWTLDPGMLAEELAAAARAGRLPRAIIAVDIFGQAADLDAILAAADRWGVPVLADSCESLGATLRGRPAGQGARLAACSFNGNKIVTAGGGGALASADAGLIARARALAGQAREATAHYQHEGTGYSYGLSSLLAAVGIEQLKALPERVAARRAIFDRYREGLGDLPGLGFMPEAPYGRSNRWLSVLRLDPRGGAPDRDQARRWLAAAGIESRPVFLPLHLQPAFRRAPRAGGAVAAAIFEDGLCLPSGSGLTPAQQGRVIARLRQLWRG